MTAEAEAAARGEALLNEIIPGWWRADAPYPVSLGDFDMDDCWRCVLGWIGGGPESGHEDPFWDVATGTLELHSPAEWRLYGFAAKDTEALEAEWTRRILARREAAA